MWANRVGWAIIVLALTLTIWNFLAYQRSAGYSSAYARWVWGKMGGTPAARPGKYPSWADTSAAWLRHRSTYVEREVLIVGGAIAAVLIISLRRDPTRVRR